MATQTQQEAKILADQMTNFVNSFGNKNKEFIEAMCNEHRTLQQSFTRLCLQWIEHCATDEYRTDGRNEATHKVSKQLVERYQELGEFDFSKDFKPSEWLPMV